MKKLLTLLLLLFSITGYGAGTVVKKIGERANVRASEGAGTTTLVYTDAKEQIFNLSAARTVKLPTTSVKAGDKWVFKNVASGDYALTIEPSGAATTLAKVNSRYAVAEAVALINTPTAVADWIVSFKYDGIAYLHGTTYNGGNAPTVASNAGNWVVTRAIFYPYQTQDGIWKLRFNIRGTTDGASSPWYLYVSGIVFKNVADFVQATTGWYTGSTSIYPIYLVAIPNTNNIQMYYSSSVTTATVSGDVELNLKPTWAY